ARRPTGIRIELIVDAAIDAASGLLDGQVVKAGETIGHAGKASGSRVSDGERDVVPAKCKLQRSRTRSPYARRVAGIRGIRRRGQQRHPRWIGIRGGFGISPPSRDGGEGPPQSVCEFARERRHETVVLADVEERERPRGV